MSASPLDLWVKPLQCIPDLLRELGTRPQVVFRKVGIDPAILRNPDNRLDMAQVGALIAECVAATKCDHFGLLVGQRSGPESVGLIYELMPLARTVRHALYALRTHMHLHNRGGVAALMARLGDRQVELAYVTFRPNTPAAGHLADIALAVGIHLLRRLCGATWTPDEVMFPRRRPADARPYRNFVRAPLVFDAPHAAIVMPKSLLDRPRLDADARKEAAILAAVASAEAEHPISLTLRLRSLVSAMLLGNEPSIAQIASAFAMSSRTLRRHLTAEGTTFSAVVDSTKAELARQLILETNMSMHEIAETLHYSEASAFSRAFSSWYGMSPQAVRNTASRATRGGRSSTGDGSLL
jgi:AraC-like DNA-binding protein